MRLKKGYGLVRGVGNGKWLAIARDLETVRQAVAVARSRPVTLTLAAGPERLTLPVEMNVLQALLQRLPQPLDTARLSGEDLLQVIEFAVLPQLEAIERASGQPVALLAFSSFPCFPPISC